MNTLITIVVLALSLSLSGTCFAWNYWDNMNEQDEMRYNPDRDKYEYATPDAELKYNPYSDKYEYVEPKHNQQPKKNHRANEPWWSHTN